MMAQRAQTDRYAGATTLGVDVSKWQGAIDWNAVANDSQSVKYAIVRTGDGINTDNRALENAINAKSAGLAVGFYHFFRGEQSGEAQAAIALNAISQSGVRPFAVFADLERGEAPDVARELKAFIRSIERGGYRVGIYGGQWIHWQLSQAHPDLAAPLSAYLLWVPSYSPGAPRMPTDGAGNGFPWSEWTFHQYSSSGHVNGISGNVDLNRFRGGLARFRAWALMGKVGGAIVGPIKSNWVPALIVVLATALIVALMVVEA